MVPNGIVWVFKGALCVTSILGEVGKSKLRIGVGWFLLYNFFVDLSRFHYLLLFLKKITKVKSSGKM